VKDEDESDGECWSAEPVAKKHFDPRGDCARSRAREVVDPTEPGVNVTQVAGNLGRMLF